MRYERWAPVYERLRSELGFRWEAERASADRLVECLGPGAAANPIEALSRRIAGRDAVIVGLAPRAGAPPVFQLPRVDRRPVLLAADGATEGCLAAQLVPEIVVTDLDGPVPSEIAAQGLGAEVVIHAHGDNRESIERWVPEFHAPTFGSWAGPPTPRLLNVGGFTDGDRAAYLAEACGARRVLLWGFDFRTIDPGEPAPERKLAKLRWAESALAFLAEEVPGKIFRWAPDGRIEPYRAQMAGSTRPPETQ